LASDLQSELEPLEGHLLSRCARSPSTYGGLSSRASVALLLTLGALVVDYLLAPALYNGSTLWLTGALLVLILRGREDLGWPEMFEALRMEQSWPLLLFALLHITFILVGRVWASALHAASLTYTASGGATALIKVLILLPTVVLLPPATWTGIIRTFRSELVASGVVFFTFFPHRIFETIWPWYSHLLGIAVCGVTRWFVPSLVCSAGIIPSFSGPKLQVSIIFACSGLDSLRLFQVLFGLIVAIEWKRLRRGRALIAYFAGLAMTLIANLLRISLLVILGNRGFTEWIMQQHVNAGWAVFTLEFLTFLTLTYNWMLQPKQALLS